MSASSNNNGRAYEYAWMTALFDTLDPIRKTDIVCNSSYDANKRAWDAVSQKSKDNFTASAKAAVDAVIELEPLMEENSRDTLALEFQKDEAGETGDVRDIVIRRDEIKWEVGLSIKHNHSAVKHSRLSDSIDFGNKWFGVPCSQSYWNDVAPIFEMLNCEKRLGTKWSELNDKKNDVYVPLLQAFRDEVMRSYGSDSDVAIRMFEYLVGIKDFHKIVNWNSKGLTYVYTYNLHGTLSQPSELKASAFDVSVAELPNKIFEMRFKRGSKTTVEMYMDNGWAFSFRIHSADDIVQPSLKFDVKFISTPVSVLCIKCLWNKR